MAWIELDGAVNVRDLGDLPTEDGQKTARARLLRGDNLQDLSAADVRKLVCDIGVTTVVDLRSTNELAAEGPAPLDAVAGVRHAHHPVLPEVGSNAQLHQPRAETMAAFLEQMDARYGGVSSWLTDHGLSAADLAALRVKLRAAA
jgi:protein tyrosine/serine phosphatase